MLVYIIILLSLLEFAYIFKLTVLEISNIRKKLYVSRNDRWI